MPFRLLVTQYHGMTLQACSAWLRDHRARQRFEAVECVLDDDTTEVSQGSAVPARSIPMVPRPPEKDSPVQDPTMQQIELFDPDSGETYMARIIGPSSATECKVPKKGADQPNDDYITIDLARYPVTIDDNCTIAVHDDPIVIEQSDPVDEPRVVDLIEGRPVASIIHSISGKQLEEHVDVELVPMRTEQSGVECKNTGEDDRLHIQALEEFLKDLGWQEE